MPEHESTQTLEGRNRIVTESSCLITLFAHDSYTDRCGLNHIYIVGAVTDSKRKGGRFMLHDELNSLRLLVR